MSYYMTLEIVTGKRKSEIPDKVHKNIPKLITI